MKYFHFRSLITFASVELESGSQGSGGNPHHTLFDTIAASDLSGMPLPVLSDHL